MEFNVGDIVVGTGDYNYTGRGSINKVVEILTVNHIRVKCLHPSSPFESSSDREDTYIVFKSLFRPATEDDIKLAEEKKNQKIVDVTALPKKRFVVPKKEKDKMGYLLSLNYEEHLSGVFFIALGDNPTYYTNKPCHGGLKRRNFEGVTKWVVSAIQAPATPEEKKYFNWLCKSSPYKYVIHNNDLRDIKKRGFITRTDVPSNYMLGACIASRYNKEHPNIIKLMYKLVDKGVDETSAFILAHVFIKDSGDYYRLFTDEDETLSIYPTYFNKEFLYNFANINLKNPTDTYENTGTYMDVFSLWSGAEEHITYYPESVNSIFNYEDVYEFASNITEEVGFYSSYSVSLFTIEDILKIYKEIF